MRLFFSKLWVWVGLSLAVGMNPLWADQRHATHTLFIVAEPEITGDRLSSSAVAEMLWRIEFTYPDGNHDAEGVAVDTLGGEIFVLTKRDAPPLLFALPLKPVSGDRPVVARRVAAVDRIPPPSSNDRLHPYGHFSSQPTALDLSIDGLSMVVLTYKHAYLFLHGRQIAVRDIRRLYKTCKNFLTVIKENFSSYAKEVEI